MIFIKFRDLEGFTFRYFLTQFLPWFVAQDSAIECLTYVGYAAGLSKMQLLEGFSKNLF
jgi:hypothetical protein